MSIPVVKPEDVVPRVHRKRVVLKPYKLQDKVGKSGPGADESGIPRKTVYNVLRAIMPERKAGELAGYSVGKAGGVISRINENEGTVSEIRERVQNDPRFGFLRQLNFYAGMRDDKQVEPASRISAAKQLDSVAGYNAPAKVEIDNRHALLAAVRVVHQVTGQLGMSPMQLKGELAKVIEGQKQQRIIEDGAVFEDQKDQLMHESQEPISEGVTA